jgi:hypothetical protein
MRNNRRIAHRSNKGYSHYKYQHQLGFLQKRSKRKWIAIGIAVYITFLLLSTVAFSADRVIDTKMKDYYEYNLRFNDDGYKTHYYVELINTSKVGTINVKYTPSSNSLDVITKNIKVLQIDCRSMYEDECKNVYGFDPAESSNYYKWYFIEKDHLNINVDSEYNIEELSFLDTPIPARVVVNGEVQVEEMDYSYTNNFGTVLSDVPYGKSNVDIYFKSKVGHPPDAVLYASKTVASVNESLVLDGSDSTDSDGNIITYIMDFGDGTFRSGDKIMHSYSEPGVYGVVLTVRDNDYLVDHEYLNITVVETSNMPKIQGIVPNQVKPEDSNPWSLDLEPFKPIARTPGIEFYWHITDENKSLYTVLDENGTDDEIIFQPIPNAFGNDLVKLWLVNSEGVSVYQYLWINLTPVNDPPSISNVPDLIVHYDDPYTFNFEPYISDIETSNKDLIQTIFDGYTENYITVNGLSATFNYPQKLVGEVIYATISVSDKINTTQKVFSIGVTSDYVPKLLKKLPDIYLYEGTTKPAVFDLDDYFTDPDDDSIFFSYGYTHLTISINPDHTVDVSADSEWTGTELVTFRARDPVGALAEDAILITVLPVNDPPMIAGVPNFFIRYDNDYRFDLTPYVADNDNTTQELRIIVSDPEHIRLDFRNNMVIILNYPEEFLGKTESVRLTVSDGLATSFDEITVTITEDFPPELINPIPDIIFLEDEPYINALDLNSYFLDVDGDVLFYTTGNKNIKISITDNHLLSFSAPANWHGSEDVYIRATDPTGALQEDLILVTVLPVNDPPMINQIPPQYGNESKRWVVELTDYIFDIDNNITELIIQSDSDYIVVSGTTLIFLGSPDMPDHVEITVSDGEYTVSVLVDIYLNLKETPEGPTFWEFIQLLIPYVLLIILIIVLIQIYLYRKRSSYEVEEVFLIHKGGTLINHLIKHGLANVDDIIFSGMFTAVQDFIHDTFGKDDDSDSNVSFDQIKNKSKKNDWVLDELKLGDKNILIERSENAYLAVIFSGEGSKYLRKKISKLLSKIESKYSDILPNWDGDVRALAGVKKILSVLVREDKNNEKDIKSKSKNEPPAKHDTIYNDNRVIVTQNIAQSQNILPAVDQEDSIDQEQIEQLQVPIKTQKLITKNPVSSKQINDTDNQDDEDLDEEADGPESPFEPSDDSSKVKVKPVKVKMPNSDKIFEIDPTKSILQQLAEMEDFDDGWPED